MLDLLVGATRFLIGGKIVFDLTTQLYPELLNTPLEDASYQQFVDKIARSQKIFKQIFIRKDGGESPSWVGAYNIGDLYTRHPQIIVAKDRLKNSNDLKFAIVHELGHLNEHHGLIIQSILISNMALFALPIIPFKSALLVNAFSAIAMIPIFRWMEIRADNFAFANCPQDVIQGAFRKDTPIPTGLGRIFGGNIAKRIAAIESHSTNLNEF